MLHVLSILHPVILLLFVTQSGATRRPPSHRLYKRHADPEVCVSLSLSVFLSFLVHSHPLFSRSRFSIRHAHSALHAARLLAARGDPSSRRAGGVLRLGLCSEHTDSRLCACCWSLATCTEYAFVSFLVCAYVVAVVVVVCAVQRAPSAGSVQGVAVPGSASGTAKPVRQVCVSLSVFVAVCVSSFTVLRLRVERSAEQRRWRKRRHETATNRQSPNDKTATDRVCV